MKPEDKAVVQQAFKTLDAIHKHGDIACVMTEEGEFYLAPAIAALRQLLEQTEPVREPAFYWDRDCFFVRPERAKFLNLDVDAMQALYATPQAQPAALVGLDEDEVEDCARGCASNAEFARAIIAKLREKNGGA